MRRTDREITDPAAVDLIIRQSPCCRLGLRDGDGVYIVPLSFGFTHLGAQRTFYFHSAAEGHKLNLLRQSLPIGFELDLPLEVTPDAAACGHSMRYQSVLGQGRVRFLDTPAEKAAALQEIMRQNTGRADWTFPPASLDRIAVFALDVTSITAKQHL